MRPSCCGHLTAQKPVAWWWYKRTCRPVAPPNGGDYPQASSFSVADCPRKWTKMITTWKAFTRCIYWVILAPPLEPRSSLDNILTASEHGGTKNWVGLWRYGAVFDVRIVHTIVFFLKHKRFGSEASSKLGDWLTDWLSEWVRDFSPWAIAQQWRLRKKQNLAQR